MDSTLFLCDILACARCRHSMATIECIHLQNIDSLLTFNGRPYSRW